MLHAGSDNRRGLTEEEWKGKEVRGPESLTDKPIDNHRGRRRDRKREDGKGG